ncbi:MAG TPA: gliding motility-associated C-terminal domain-containing protein [Bacteroidetes bacterium]|nr:gliding motility-associated C-terminal domain-containing protein [Bacteroidota bacterium]
MSSLLKFLSFVPPILLFVLPAYSQIQGKLVHVAGTNTYQVSAVPTVSWVPPQSVTSDARITLRAPTGKLTPSNLQSQTGGWTAQSPVIAPAEAPGFDYFSFSLDNPLLTVAYNAGSALPLFSFENNGQCTEIEIVNNATDPFAGNNSLNVNFENFFTIVGANLGVNAYEGNAQESATSCPSLGLSVTANDNPVRCNGDVTPVTVQAIDGTEPYTVVYSNTANGATASTPINSFEGTAFFNNLPAGLYTFTITDALDSIEQVEYEIAQPNKLTIDVEASPATCDGSLDGAAIVSSANGGTVANDYQYYWNTNPGISTPSIGFLDPGTYTVTVEDDNGCQATESVEVGTFLLFFLNADITDIKCHGDANGVIDVFPVSTTGPFTFDWSANAQNSDGSAAWMLGPGTYTVTVTDNTGFCTATEDFVIEEPEAIDLSYALQLPECYGDQAFLTGLSVLNAAGPYEVGITGSYTQISDTDYEVEPGVPLMLEIVDSVGCKYSEEFLIPAQQEITVDLGDDLSIKYGETVNLSANVFPLADMVLEWSPSPWLSCLDCPDPSGMPTETGTYLLTVTDPTGCSAQDEITIDVRKSRDIYIPNAFSPNQDGINDIFRPYGGFEIVAIRSMTIFDRWGGIVYNNEKGFVLANKTEGWNGFANDKKLDQGVYLYTMNVEFIDGETVLFSGEITLMK